MSKWSVCPLCCQAAPVRLGVLHLVGEVGEAQGRDAFWADGTSTADENFVVVHRTGDK